jgi:hypothetical protein
MQTRKNDYVVRQNKNSTFSKYRLRNLNYFIESIVFLLYKLVFDLSPIKIEFYFFSVTSLLFLINFLPII